MDKLNTIIKFPLPTNTPRCRIGGLVDLVTPPKRLNKSQYQPTGKYPIIDQGKSFIVAYTDDESALVKQGKYVVFGDHTREIKYVDFPFAQGADGIKILNSHCDILPKYLYYALLNAPIPNLGYSRHWSKAKDVEIPLPPLPVQHDIVRILDSFTDLQGNLQKELKAREKQYEAYRDKILSFRHGKQSCSEIVQYMSLSELGFFYGGLSGKNKDDFKSGNAKFISYMNIFNNPALKIDVLDRVRINEGEKQNTIQYGDILFTGSSETPDECGMSSVLTERTDEPLYLNSFSFGFRFHNLSSIEPRYCKHLFRCFAIREQIAKTANGVTRFNVSKQLFAKIVIPIPPLPVQIEIANTLDSFTELQDNIKEEITARNKQYEYYREQLLTF